VKLDAKLTHKNVEVLLVGDDDNKPKITINKDGDVFDELEISNIIQIEDIRASLANAVDDLNCTTVAILLLSAWIQYSMQEDLSWLSIDESEGIEEN